MVRGGLCACVIQLQAKRSSDKETRFIPRSAALTISPRHHPEDRLGNKVHSHSNSADSNGFK